MEIRDIEGRERITFQSGEIAVIRTHILFHYDIEKNLTVGYRIKGKYSEIFGINTWWEGINLGAKKNRRITNRAIL